MAWITRISLFWTFAALLAFHILLYYAQGTDNWLAVAVLASVVDTVVLGVVQYLVSSYWRQRQR